MDYHHCLSRDSPIRANTEEDFLEVLVLTPEWLPVYGGIGNYVLQLAKEMPREIHLNIVTPRRNANEEVSSSQTLETEDQLRDNVNVRFIGSAKDAFYHNFSFQVNCARRVPKMVRDLGIEIVHSQSTMPDFLISPRKLGVPIVTTIHTTIEGHVGSLRTSGIEPSEMNSPERFAVALGPVLKILENRYYTDHRHYLTVSKWACNDVVTKKGVSESRIRVVYIGVDSERYNPSRRQNAAATFPQLADIDAPKVLYLSRMATRKGLHHLLKAIPKVLQKTDAHFVFGGAGERPSFDIPESNYTYLGYVPRNNLPGLYAISDIFTLPSLYENFPAVLLEAMSSGCAAVATKICGIPEMITDGEEGILIPPGDVDAIADSITRLVDDNKLRRTMGTRARNTVIQRFNWRDTATRTARYFEEILDGRLHR